MKEAIWWKTHSFSFWCSYLTLRCVYWCRTSENWPPSIYCVRRLALRSCDSLSRLNLMPFLYIRRGSVCIFSHLRHSSSIEMAVLRSLKAQFWTVKMSIIRLPCGGPTRDVVRFLDNISKQLYVCANRSFWIRALHLLKHFPLWKTRVLCLIDKLHHF